VIKDANCDPVGVVIVEQDPLRREGLAHAIASQHRIKLLAVAARSAQARELVTTHQPQVMVLGLQLELERGTRLLSELKRTSPDIRALVIGAFTDPAVAAKAMRAGADGYLATTAGAREICQAIVRIAAGGTALSAESAARSRSNGSATRQAAVLRLTVREQELLFWLAEPVSAQEIAEQLHMSRSTVKSHALNLYDKLGTHHRAAAIATAFRAGLLE
jgi:two-component system nitrate/nitrite response regulator NarL